MSGSRFTLCRAGVWTRLYAGPSVGVVRVWSGSPGQAVRFRAFTANLPFYFEGGAFVRVGEGTPVLFGLPTLFVDFAVMPDRDAFFAAV